MCVILLTTWRSLLEHQFIFERVFLSLRFFKSRGRSLFFNCHLAVIGNCTRQIEWNPISSVVNSCEFLCLSSLVEVTDCQSGHSNGSGLLHGNGTNASTPWYLQDACNCLPFFHWGMVKLELPCVYHSLVYRKQGMWTVTMANRMHVNFASVLTLTSRFHDMQ